ncbi:MAG: hypothetical protein EAZ64_00780 [Sphingobacteriales bacterium]|nr:MAG: hypothetical protein EAZ64_00780 [Sphingobacteriales bacterium]
MKNIIFILLLVFLISINAKAQPNTPTVKRAQNVYVELLGQGIFLTANYDTRFANKRDGRGGRAGIGFISAGSSAITTIPIGINYLIGKKSSFFEVGLGVTYILVQR